MKAIRLVGLTGLLLLLLLGLGGAEAQVPTEVIPYQATGYRFKVYSPGTTPGDYGSETFDDSAFSVGDAAFGSGGGCPLQSTVATTWPVNTELVVRKTFDLPTGATNLAVMVSIDNDVEVFLNGVNISGGLVAHGWCPTLDQLWFAAPDSLLRAGNNLLAVRAVDRGDESFLDLRVLLDAGPAPPPTVPVGVGPYGVAVNPAANRVYVTNYYSRNVSVIDGSTNTVVATVPVGSYPSGVAVNPGTNRVYVANADSNSVSVIDGDSNTVVTTVPVGSGPRGVAVNPGTNRIYVANGGNNVSVIDGPTNTVTATVPVGSGPSGVAVNPTTNRVYACNWLINNVSVIEGDSNTVVATVPVSHLEPYGVGVAVNPGTNRIYVANLYGSNVSVIDGDSNTVVATVPVGSGPLGVAVNPGTNRIYVANGGNNVSVIDGTTNTVVATVRVGSYPFGVAVNPGTNRIYVANHSDGSVSVIYDPPSPTPTPTPPPAVGGTVDLERGPSAASADAGDSPALPYVAIAGAAAAAFAVLGGAWYVRRRRAR